MKYWRLALVVTIVPTTGCFWSKKPKTVQTPPQPAQRTASPRQTPAHTHTAKTPAPEKPHVAAPVVTVPAPQPPPIKAAPLPAGDLGEMLSDADRVRLNQVIDQGLSNARRNLSIASRRTLTLEQSRKRKLIETFVMQAETARSRNDLSTAAQLARRAELLSQSLAAP